MAVGTVKFFNTQKGFGFITPSDGSRDVFVHISAVERSGMTTLNEGQRLTYDVVTERGKQAAATCKEPDPRIRRLSRCDRSARVICCRA
jgi:cold shock protein